MRHHRAHEPLLWMLAFSALIMFAGCKKAAAPSETRQVMGANVTISILDPGTKQQDLQPVLQEAFTLLEDWDRKVLQPGGDNQVAGLSRGAGQQSIPTDPDVFDMLMKALRLYDASGKTFDIRYGPMLDAWGFSAQQPRVPTAAELDTAKTLVEQGGMFVAGNSILLAKKGMRFDVREIALGYGFDLVAARLAEKGIRSATICSPRVCRTMGDAPDKRGFKLALAHPLTGAENWATVWAPVGGIAYAPGTVDRFETGGKVYHSLLDPRTGQPAAGCVGAVVQSPDAATAQALAYGMFVSCSDAGFDANGKAAVGGSVLMKAEGGQVTTTATGSLADHFEAAR